MGNQEPKKQLTKITMKRIFTLLLVISQVVTLQAKKYDLGLNLEVGETYKQVSEAEATVIQNYNGQEVKIVIEIQGSMAFLVKSEDEKSYMMDVKYESMSMNMEMPNGKTSFSSDKKDENDILSMVLGAMINKTFEIKMTKKGKITEVNNIENVFNSAFDNFPDLSEAQVTQIKEQLMKSYGENSFKGSIETVTYLFPKNEVAQGEEWVVKTKMESGMSADVTTTYVLVGEEGGQYLIEGKSEIETDKNASSVNNGMSMTYDLTGNSEMKIKIDKNTGWIVESDIRQVIQGEAFIEKNEKIPDGMKIPMIMKNETSFSNE